MVAVDRLLSGIPVTSRLACCGASP
jgi:hypothetical protein